MIRKFLVIVWSLILCSGLMAGAQDQGLSSADGPYITHNDDGSARYVQVLPDGTLIDTLYASIPADFNFKVQSSDGSISFDVSLHEIRRPDWKYEKPDTLFIMSDPHGRLDLFCSLLTGNGIIDDQLRWNFGRNHLTILGDVFDRGDDATQIFWLIYKLEEEARCAGGNLTFIYGNHETMVLAGDVRYTNEKYSVLADSLGTTIPALYGLDTEIGRWLATRNTIQVIGRNMFVHAGLSDALAERDMDIQTLNEEVSAAMFMTKKERNARSELTKFLFGNEGPIWHRGLVIRKEKYYPTDADVLARYLERNGADRVFVGHTIFKDIRTFYRKKVIAVNVDNARNHDRNKGRAVMAIGDRYYVVKDNGRSRRLAL